MTFFIPLCPFENSLQLSCSLFKCYTTTELDYMHGKCSFLRASVASTTATKWRKNVLPRMKMKMYMLSSLALSMPVCESHFFIYVQIAQRKLNVYYHKRKISQKIFDALKFLQFNSFINIDENVRTAI